MIFITIIYILTIVALLLVRGAHPERSRLSQFELKRLAKIGQPGAKESLRREALLHDVYSLQHVVTAVLIVTVSTLGMIIFPKAVGFLVSIFIALESGAVARLRLVASPSNAIYQRYETKVLNLIERFPKVFRLLRSVAPLSGEHYVLQSKEELIEIVNQSDQGAITDQEKQLILHGLKFKDRLVEEVMTPRDQVDFVSKNEVLGPLVLDELHKTGHSRFPVIDEDEDYIVGILHIRSLFNLDQKRSLTVEKAMEPNVSFIRHDHTLAHALTAFLRTRHHLFVVIDASQKTVGVLSLEDVVEALLGHELRDEFEADNDKRAVADRIA